MDLPPPPPVEIVETITAEDLIDTNPLFTWVQEVIEATPGSSYEEKELAAVKEHLPIPTADAYLIFQMEGLWGNGGMQLIVLDREPGYVPEFLALVAKAYERCGSPKKAKYITQLQKKSEAWEARTAQLEGKVGVDAEWEALWKEIDQEDEVFDAIREDGPTAYEVIEKELRTNPSSFVVKRSESG